MVIVAACFVRSRRVFSNRAGGTPESSGGVEIEGYWTRLAETWSEDRFSDNIFFTGLLVRDLSGILGYLVLNLSTAFADAVKSFENR